MIDGEGFKQEGAFNLRENGISICHGDSEHVKIRKKEDRQGIDIYIDKDTNGETVHIPVVVSSSGMTDVVYNDFYIEDGAKVTIIAGCGIHNSGCNDARHDGIHTFHSNGKYKFYALPKAVAEPPEPSGKIPAVHLKRTPLCARVISPGRGILPPPASAVGEMV